MGVAGLGLVVYVSIHCNAFIMVEPVVSDLYFIRHLRREIVSCPHSVVFSCKFLV